jgi:DNA-binding XRE family transcriptional regulator
MRITPKPGVLRDYMKAEDISRDELARRVGVDRATAYRIESDMVAPSTKFIAGLMLLTGRKFEDLFQIKDVA